jgi:hypothetical protein
MKILTALVTALTLVGFGSAAFACEGNMFKRTKADTAQTDKPILPPAEKTS